MTTNPDDVLPQPSARDWQQIFALLDTALELDPAAQPQWLASLAPEHAHLSPMLERLLRVRAQVSTSDFMRPLTGFVSTGLAAPPELGPQSLVGPYRLLREIGRGGMASVWLAMRADGLLDRQIALKLPHTSWGDAALADRMARERSILASLAHPNIARLYDAGIAADGRPFLALEYVEGEAIDAYAGAHALSVRERVALVVQVARAVAHAHARLVVHRDLKPSNIMVDAQGQVHLLDFGIAKLVDGSLGDAAVDGDGASLTQANGRALTPDYASPEQIRGDLIGTASDVYSLGVVLFELLAGARPYRLPRGLGAAALAVAVVQADAPRPSAVAMDPAVQRQLKGDLDAIVARAICKASGERYATIDAFADDLERHLRNEPVGARPDSHWYRAERWVRRHKLETAVAAALVVAVPAGAAAQAAVLTAIGAGAAVALWQMRLARRQAQLAQDQAARAAAVKSFLTSFFKSGSLDDEAGAQLGRLSVQRFVERGAQKIDAGFAHQPALKNELLDVVSTLFADLSDGAATVEYARQWLRTLDQLTVGEDERAHATRRLAQGLTLLGRNAEAACLLASSVARLRAHPAGAASTLLAHLLVDLARARHALGEVAEGLAGADEALALLAARAGADAATAEAHASALFLRAELMAANNRLAEARPLYEDAISRLAALHGERSPTVARHRFALGQALNAGRQAAEAAQEFRRVLRLFREAGGADDLNAAIVELELGRCLQLTGNARAESRDLLEHARTVFAARADSVSPLYPAAANLFLAEALIDDGELERAREPMETAAALFRDRVQNAPERTLAQMIHARFLSESGDYDGADRVLEAVRADRLRLMGPDHPLTASVANRIGLNHLRRQDFVRARTEFESILGSEDHGEDLWGSVKHMARQNLAVTRLDAGDAAGALPVLQRNFERYQAGLPEAANAMTEASMSLNLGRALLLDGQAAGALPLLQRHVEILAALQPNAPGLAAGRCWLGMCVLARGDVQQARALAERAAEVMAAPHGAAAHHRRGLTLLVAQLATRATIDSSAANNL